MEDNKQLTPDQQLDAEEIIIGNTTYIVKSNAKSVPKAFVKKTVEKMLFDDLKRKI